MNATTNPDRSDPAEATEAVRTPTGATYRSGVAARLAGIPVETLRVWERRYRVVGPRLSPRGQRLYGTSDIQRLSMIKQLVDAGHSIGTLAELPTDVLIAMQSHGAAFPSGPNRSDAAEPAVRVVLVGPLISTRRFEESLADGALTVVGRCVSVNEAGRTLSAVRADVAVIEVPTLDDDAIGIVNSVKTACGAARAIVLYRFAPSAMIRQLRSSGHDVARAPADATAIDSLIRSRLHAQSRPAAPAVLGGDPPPPRFNEHALSALAAASTTVYCECPRHLVELVSSLGSFERYSAYCANRGEEDAALHQDLHRTTGHARAMIEAALLRVAIAEGLPVLSPTPQSA